MLLIFPLKAQPLFTKLKAGYTLEMLGVGPGLTFSAEAPFSYRTQSFWNAQVGIGFSSNRNGLAPSLSGAVSHNFLLNPYYRSLCRPQPFYKRIEAYIESGVALSVFDPTYALVPDSFSEKTLFPMGLLGMRFHFVGEKWLYMLKIRFSPVLGEAILPWGGIGLGMGW